MAILDDFTRSWYQQRFTVEFYESEHSAFQDLFSSLMEKRYPADFQRVRPWGGSGDQKCDGYLASERTIFQVYAPSRMSSKKTITKIEDDFNGALPYWEDHFSSWTFVHNSRQGLSPEVLKKLLYLGREHAQIMISHWGYQELLEKVLELDQPGLQSLLGPIPSQSDLMGIGVEDVQPIFEHIATLPEPKENEIRPVSPRKLVRNQLSPFVETLLKAGMRRELLISKYFERQINPALQDRIAAAFRNEYEKLNSQGLPPDDIFLRLQAFAGGQARRPPRHECAVLTTLAYLFQRCDIFEDPEA